MEFLTTIRYKNDFLLAVIVGGISFAWLPLFMCAFFAIVNHDAKKRRQFNWELSVLRFVLFLSTVDLFRQIWNGHQHESLTKLASHVFWRDKWSRQTSSFWNLFFCTRTDESVKSGENLVLVSSFHYSRFSLLLGALKYLLFFSGKGFWFSRKMNYARTLGSKNMPSHLNHFQFTIIINFSICLLHYHDLYSLVSK